MRRKKKAQQCTVGQEEEGSTSSQHESRRGVAMFAYCWHVVFDMCKRRGKSDVGTLQIAKNRLKGAKNEKTRFQKESKRSKNHRQRKTAENEVIGTYHVGRKWSVIRVVGW